MATDSVHLPTFFPERSNEFKRERVVERTRQLLSGLVFLCCLLTLANSAEGQGRNSLVFDSQMLLFDGSFYDSFADPIHGGGAKIAVSAGLTNSPVGRERGVFVGIWDRDSAFNSFLQRPYNRFEIVRSGDSAPDGNGSFDLFDIENYTLFGDVNFSASLTGSSDPLENTGRFTGWPNATSGGSTVVRGFRGGAASPAGNGEFYSAFGRSVSDSFTGTETLAFVDGGVNGPAEVVVTSLGEIARTGTVADGGGVFNSFGDITHGFFSANTGPGVTGVYSSGTGTARRVARSGDAAPGFGGNDGSFDTIQGISGSGNNQVAFSATLVGTSNGTNNDSGIFIGNENGVSQIYREGGVSGVQEYRDVMGVPIINRAGDVVFRVDLQGGGEAILKRNSDGTFKELVRSNGLLFGNTISTITDFALSQELNTGNDAFIAFEATHNNGGKGIYMSNGDEFRLIAETGGNVTDVSFRGSRGNLNDGLSDFDGEVAYRATLANGTQQVYNYIPELEWRGGASGFFSDSENWTFGITPSDVHDIVLYNFDAPLEGVSVALNPLLVARFGSMTLGFGVGLRGQDVLDLSGGRIEAIDILVTNSARIVGQGVIDASIYRSRAISAPGNSPGSIEFTGTVIFEEESILEIELASTTSFDQLIIGGDFDVGGQLDVQLLNGFVLSEGDSFLIADVGGITTGGFVGLAQDARVARFGDYALHIDYLAGDGNDVRLYALQAIPEPAWGGLVLIVGCFRRRRLTRSTT